MEPVFAVVGHPNKGKSSIVATLSQDDSVRIAPEPGTTVGCRRFPMQVDGQLMYTVVDTPGFQRARRALAWMKKRETSAAEHAAVVKAFLEAHRDSSSFTDECELLGPIIDGAGILYVVDGSNPYGSEYEAEMEILRWTGQPSMALVNPIGPHDHIDEWQAALTQYFKVVRVFNAMTAEFEKRLDLLRAFGQLRDQWRSPLDSAVESLRADRQHRHHRSARAIAEMISQMLTYSVSKHLAVDGDVAAQQPKLQKRYEDQLRRREHDGRREIERIHDHSRLHRREQQVELVSDDLFSQEAFFLFGLSRRQLLATGAASGAVAGGVLDASVGATSFMTGSLLGAAVGGVLAWHSVDRIGKFQVFQLPIGGKRLRCGPTKNINLPYVLVGRALQHYEAVAGRTHAQRSELVLREDAATSRWVDGITPQQRKEIERYFRKLRRADDIERTCTMLASAVEPLLRG